MNDKKLCQNCGHLWTDLLGCNIKSKCHDFAKWERPTYLWLSILPTEPGHWWYRLKTNHTDWGMMDITAYEIKHWEENKASRIHVEHFEWQGPIAPKEAK